jgi:hypothetical protein
MTLGANLERDRLTRRARRVRAVIDVLRRQAVGGRAAAHGGERHIFQAIARFEAELSTIDARLSDLTDAAPPAQTPTDPPRDWTTT